MGTDEKIKKCAKSCAKEKVLGTLIFIDVCLVIVLITLVVSKVII